ncbi:MAG: hypothetical protein J0653_05525, partial [Deltaproteobacteria bacterium]|nr:hypothetical protein [Deltaproteobacteria bacterium]
MDYTHQSSLYQDHRLQLLSHYKAWPGYQAGSEHPRDAAIALIKTLSEGQDPRLLAYAEHMGSTDPE